MLDLSYNGWVVDVNNFDIKTATKQQAQKIGKLAVENMVVVIRNQDISPAQQLQFCNYIGNIQPTDSERVKHISLESGVLRVTGQKNQHGEEGLFGHTSALDWHANQASNYERKPLIWLYGAENTKGSVTSWINNIKSYEALPDDVKKEIEEIQITLGYKKNSYSSSSFFIEHHAQDRPFDLVHTNKAGFKGLYFPFLQIFGMKGIDDKRFNSIMSLLKNHILQNRFRYDHHWQDGDVVISEQWLSIHKRWHFDKMDRRVLHRIAFDYDKIY